MRRAAQLCVPLVLALSASVHAKGQPGAGQAECTVWRQLWPVAGSSPGGVGEQGLLGCRVGSLGPAGAWKLRDGEVTAMLQATRHGAPWPAAPRDAAPARTSSSRCMGGDDDAAVPAPAAPLLKRRHNSCR